MMKMRIFRIFRRKTGTAKNISSFIEIPISQIIKESQTETPSYCDKKYMIYDSGEKIHINACHSFQGEKARLCIHYDRKLCDTLEEYNHMPVEYIEAQAYGAWMDGAR